MEEELQNSSPILNSSPIDQPRRLTAKERSARIKNPNRKMTAAQKYARIITNNKFENTSAGKSKYDQNINWETDVDKDNIEGSLNEHRYNEQSGFTQLGAGVGRAGVKAASEIAKLPGVVVGGVMAIGAKEGEGYDTMFNNEWIKTIDKVNEHVNTEILPIYVGKAIKEGSLMDNVMSTSFWATEGADGLGYMVAMMAPGAIINKLGLGAKLISGTAKAARLLKMGNLVEAGVTGLKAANFTAKSIDIGVGAVANTFFEAGAEAKGVGDHMDQRKPEFDSRRIPELMAKLNPGGLIPEMIQGPFEAVQNPDGTQSFKSQGLIPNPEYQALQTKAIEQSDSEFKEQRALAMRDNFKMNLALLIGPNLLMSKAIWGKPANKLVATAEKTGLKSLGERGGQWAKRWGAATVSEGFVEEAGQSTSEKIFTEKGLKGELKRNDGTGTGFLGDFEVGDLTKGYIDTVTSVEGQKAILLGAVMGGGMMGYQGRKEDVANRKATNEILANVDTRINNFNTILENDIYKTNEDGSPMFEKDSQGIETTRRVLDVAKAKQVVKALNFKEQQSLALDRAIEEGDQDVVRSIHQQAVFDMISPAIHNNEAGIDALEQQLKESSKFQEIIARDATSSNKDKSENFVKNTLDVARHLQKQNEKFNDFANDVIDLRDNRATPEDKKEFLSRLNAQYLNNKYAQYNSEKNLTRLIEKRNNMLEELGVNNQMAPEEILKNQMLISQLSSKNKAFSKVLTDIISEEESIAKNKKDVIEVWNGKNAIDNSFKSYMDAITLEQKETSEEEVAKNEKLLIDLENVKNNQELNEIINSANLTDEELKVLDPKIQLLEAQKIQNEEDSIEEQGLIQEQINQKIKREKVTKNKTAKELVNINRSINDLESALEVALKGSIKDVDSIMDIINERSKLFNSNTKLNTKKGEINSGQIVQFKKDIRDVNKLANNIQSKIKQLRAEKESLERLRQVTNERIQQYESLLGQNLDFTKLTSRIKSLEKKAKKIDGLINNITKIINELIESLKEIFGYVSKFEDQLNNFEKTNEFQTLTTPELKALLLEGKAQDYGMLKNKHDKITDQLLNALDRGEITQEMYDEKIKELNNLIKTLHRTYTQLDILKDLLISDQVEIIKDLDEKKSTIADNPVIAQKIAEKQEELADIEQLEQEELDRQAFQDFIDKEQELLESEEEIIPESPAPSPVQETDTVELGEEDETMNDTPVLDNENLTEIELNLDLDKVQPGAKVISTNRETGEKLEWIEDSYVDYERETRDKSKDSVSFSIGEEYDDEKVQQALDTYENGIIEDLENNTAENQLAGMQLFLPIAVTFADKTTSFLEAFPINGSKQAQKIFIQESLPLRKKIVDSLLMGIDISDITTNIVKQFPGRLKVEPVNTFNHNNVLELDFFKNMTEDEKKEAFAERAFFVGYDGLKASVLDPSTKLASKESKGKGEVFLQIPMNNGKPFSLKLNFSRISEEKALAIYEIMKELSVARSLSEDFKNQLITIEDFIDHMREVSPDTARMIETTLAPEIELINNTFREPVARNLEVLLDVLVFQKSINPRTLFRFDTGTDFQVGGLKINQAPISISVNDFQDDTYKEHVISFLKNKRHNILITKDKPMSFRNKYYIDYLLNNKILNTNAVVNEPTFQGYSNIYLNSEISITEENKKEETVIKIADIISDKDFNHFIDTNQIPFEILNNIAEKIKKGETLSIREAAIYGAKTSEIEEILKPVVKVIPVIPVVEVKKSPDKIDINNLTELEAAIIANDLIEDFEKADENGIVTDPFESINAELEGKELLREMLKVLTERDAHTENTKKYCGL